MMRILIVEDDEGVHRVLDTYMKQYAAEHDVDVDVRQMTDPGKALVLLGVEDEVFDAIFLDVRMPQLSGDAIYSHLMRTRPAILEQIVFITGYRDDLTARFPGQKLNILDKPFRYRQIVEVLGAVI